MDVFYYWKDWEKDMAACRVGWLQSSRLKLGEYRERYPDKIYAFRQPTGRKGELQLIACLAWCDKPAVIVPRNHIGRSTIYYDPATSVRYENSGAPAQIAEITRLMKEFLPRAFAGNFQGDSGLHAIDGDFLRRLQRLLSCFKETPLVTSPARVA